MGAEADKSVSGIDFDLVLFQVGDDFFVVFGGEEGERAELVGVFGLEDGNVVLAENMAHFGLLGE